MGKVQRNVLLDYRKRKLPDSYGIFWRRIPSSEESYKQSLLSDKDLYIAKKLGGGKIIQISTDAPSPHLTLAHEIGHMIQLEGPSGPFTGPSGAWNAEKKAWAFALRKARGTDKAIPMAWQAKDALLISGKYMNISPKRALDEAVDLVREHGGVILAERNPERKLRKLTSSEKVGLRRLMRQLKVPAVAVTISPSSSRDIAVYGGQTPPYIVAGRKWIKAPFHERMKRICHELLHLSPGLRHNAESRRMGYYSNPNRDTYSSRVYGRILAREGK